MRLFDAYLVVDWSARQQPSSRAPTADALWVGEGIAGDAHSQRETYWRTRQTCLAFVRERLIDHVQQGRRVFCGCDFAYGYPAGFATALALRDDLPPWRRIWNELTHLIQDDDQNHNNRFVVADAFNRRCSGDFPGPFWGHPVGRAFSSLQPTSPRYPYLTGAAIALTRLRTVDAQERGLQPVWKLYGPASVGGQTLLGIPAISRLRDDLALAPISRVWPFETGFTPEPTATSGPQVIHAEIWPGIVPTRDPSILIRDQAQVRAMIAWLIARDDAGTLGACFAPPARLSAATLQNCVAEEGWIVGAGHTQ